MKSSIFGEIDKENKLEPSNLDDLIKVENSKISNENDSEYAGAHFEEENQDLNEKKNKKINNKKTNNKINNSSYRENEKGKNAKYSRNNSSRQLQNQINQTNFFSGKHNENDTQTLQYLKEAQVPLFNYKNLVNSLGKNI